MNKTRITRDELNAKVLEAIRHEPGCEGVKEIGISKRELVGEAKCWHVAIIDEGASGFDGAFHAAQRVEERLNSLYELAD